MDLNQTIVVDDEPLSVRRKRRNASIGSSPISRSSSYNLNTAPRPHGIQTPPQTPKRAKKRVRFSDPGPEIQCATPSSTSSGLTPFIRRTNISTPTSRRRHSTPSTLSNRSTYDDTPICGTLQFAPLRQVLDGRVKRRLRRNRLSEEINTIELDKKIEAKERKSELGRLRQELAAKDLEVQSVRDEQDIASQIEGESGLSPSTNTTLSTKVQELEQEIHDLKAELQRKESFEGQDADWTMAARDPFDFDDEDDNMITNYDDDFRDSRIGDEMVSTPTRLNTSFPSPPSTMPNTPSRSTSWMNAGIQTLPDQENESLKAQLQSLQTEISKLNAVIAFKDDNQTRLSEKLSEFIPADDSHDHTTLDQALDRILTELVLSQSHAIDRSQAFSALSNEISGLGFPTSGPEETLETIAQQFRQARLDLEYLTPGEVVEGFENSNLLEMLISRIRVLVQKVKEQDESIDQYHEQELLLRQQLNARVTAMDHMRQELVLSNTVVNDLRIEILDKETSNSRLQTALESYRSEVQNLELLIVRMESSSQETETQLRSEIQETESRLQNEVEKHDSTQADIQIKEQNLIELEGRLTAALNSIVELESQLNSLASTNSEKDNALNTLQSTLYSRESAHGKALALRDARVSELRREIERVNEALKSAHSTIISLRNTNHNLDLQLEGEKVRGEFVVKAMRDQISRALQTGDGYVNGDVSVRGSEGGVEVMEDVEDDATSLDEDAGEGQSGGVVKKGKFFDSRLARKSSGKKRRRYDSGLGFLEEQDELDLAGAQAAVDQAFKHF